MLMFMQNMCIEKNHNRKKWEELGGEILGEFSLEKDFFW